MAGPNQTPAPPLFIPRTVASFERNANQLAARLMAPVRTVGSRLLSFADRVVSNWAGSGSFSPSPSFSEAPAAAAGRVGQLQVARPWYETPAEAAARQPAPVRRAAPRPLESIEEPPAVVVVPALPVVEDIAARGASIERTQVTAGAEPPVSQTPRRVETPVAAPVSEILESVKVERTPEPTTTAAPTPTPVTPPASEAAPAPITAAGPTPSLPASTSPRAPEPIAPPVADSLPISPPVTAGPSVLAPPAEVRAREWLQLAPVETAPAPIVVTRPARSRSLSDRLLQHARWADDQLRSAAARNPEPLAVPSGSASYVFVSPPAPPAPESRPAARVAAPQSQTDQTVELVIERPLTPPAAVESASLEAATPVVSSPTPSVETPTVMPAPQVEPAIERAPAMVPAPVPTATVSAPAGLPDLRLTAALTPGAIADRTSSFLDRLVSTQVIRDVQPPTLFSAPTVLEAAERAPGAEYLRLEPTAEPTVSTRQVRLPEQTLESVAVEPRSAEPERLETVRTAETPRAVESSRPSEAREQQVADTTGRPDERAAAEPAAAPRTADPRSAEAPLLGAPQTQIQGAAPRQPPTAARPQLPDAGGLRPGGIGARAESLATLVDARASSSWGTPTTTVSAAPARVIPTLSYVAPAAAPVSHSTGPGRNIQFVDQLMGAEAVRETAPLSLVGLRGDRPKVVIEELAPESPRPIPTPARPIPTSRQVESRPQMPVLRPEAPPQEVRAAQAPTAYASRPEVPAAPPSSPATASAAASSAPSARPEPAVSPAAQSQSVGAPSRETVRVPIRLAAAGMRAEQLAAIIGVRAADLAIDFVDPAGLPALFGSQSVPEMAFIRGVVVPQTSTASRAAAPLEAPVVSSSPTTASAPTSSGVSEAAASVERTVQREEAARAAVVTPLVQRAVTGARLSPEEWALVATFPTAATALQLAATRRSTAFLPVELQRAAAAPERPLLTAGPASFRGAFSASVTRFEGGFTSLSGGRWLANDGPAHEDDESVPGAISRVAERGGAPAEYVVPTTPERALLPHGRQPRGGFIWPRAAGFVTTTASAVEQAASSAERAQVEAAPGTPLWEVLRPPPSMVQVQGGPTAGGSESTSSSASADIEMARPFLELVKGGVESDKSEGVRFFEQAAPVTSAVGPSSDAASKMVEAVRAQPQHMPGDERISLGDLTLVSVASATGQLAAAEEGGRPQPAAPGGGGGGGGGGHGGEGGHGGGKGADLEELARKVYDELQRVIDIERERSGQPWER